MTVEAIIRQCLAYTKASGWDYHKETQLAACVVYLSRPGWSEIQALSAVDWVRSLPHSES